MTEDTHALTGAPALLRAILLRNCDAVAAARWAETTANDMADGLSRMHARDEVDVPTAIFCHVLVAHAVPALAAEYWSSGDDPLATLPNTSAALRSFITDMVPTIDLETFIPKGA